jgi:uncharacterized protein YjbI with pentapeptide repeats
VTAEADEGEEQVASPEPSRPTADIQAILDVLRRTQASVPELYRTRLALHEANLQGANLYGAILPGAYLERAILQEAYLREASLLSAYLPGANLQGANLIDANLLGANLLGAKVSDEQLADAQSLQGATMPNGQTYEDWLKDKEGRSRATAVVVLS